MNAFKALFVLTLLAPSWAVAQVSQPDRARAARERAEFTSILQNDTAGEAFRKIGNRMGSFARREDLRRCLEALGRGREPAVMQQRFVVLVALCEIQLGIAPVKPEQRWPLP